MKGAALSANEQRENITHILAAHSSSLKASNNFT